jgi:hypothetical protein
VEARGRRDERLGFSPGGVARADIGAMRDVPPQPECAPVESPSDGGAAGPLFRFDPGWLFLIAGMAMLAATVLIPARRDVVKAEWQRDRAIAVEQFRAKRLSNYSAYLDAVNRHDPTVVISLAATQLNMLPSDKRVMLSPGDMSLPPADVFGALEPSFTDVSPPRAPRSLLQKWTTDDKKRLWLLALGGLAVLIGLLPAARGR